VSQPILTVGPRPLPAVGTAAVWIDTGSGPGYVREVSVSRLALAEVDDGQGDHAVYLLCRPGEVLCEVQSESAGPK
jgi:hypothetical protein